MSDVFTAIENDDSLWTEVLRPKPRRTPRPQPTPVAPWAAPPCVNVHHGEGGPSYIWMRLVWGWRDLDFEEWEVKYEVGDPPDWFSQTELSMKDVLHEDVPYGELSVAEWGLAHGIGLEQPFCVELYPPHWTRSRSYEGDVEVDIEWTWEIVRIMPRSPRSAMRSWGRFIEGIHQVAAEEARRKAYVEKKRQSDPKVLYIHHFVYFTESTYDDMVMPNGTCLQLCSRHQKAQNGLYGAGPVVFEVRSDEGNTTKAWDELCAKTREMFPDVDARTLPQYYQYHPHPL